MTELTSTATTSRSSIPSSAEDWFTRPRLLLLLAIFIFLAFPGIILGTESFFYRDMGLFGYPLAHYHRSAFWRGEIPLWNPLNDCGIPFLAQWNTLVLYPGSLIYLLLPLPWSMSLFVFVHVFLAAAGMYLLAWRWTESRFAACIAGLVFAWNGFVLHALMWPAVMAALAWMPWVVWTLEKAWTEGRSRSLVIASLVAAMQMLTGVPEVILLTWVVAGVFCLRDVLRGAPISSAAGRARPLARLAFCGAIVAILSAAQLLPFLELLRNSNRDSSFGGDAWAMPEWGWANFLVPLFGCTPSVTGVYSQDAQQWISSYYMGAITVVLALLSWRARDARVKWLMVITAVGIVLALGENGLVYGVVKKVIPAFGFIRFPIKFIILAVFALPLLAAFGTKTLSQETARPTQSALTRMAGVALLIIGAIILWAWWRPVAGTDAAVAATNGVWRAVLLILIVCALLVGRRPALAGRMARIVALSLIAIDILTHVPRQNPTVPNRALGELPLEMSAVPVLGETRAMVSPPMNQVMRSAAVADPFTFYSGLRRSFLENCNLLDGVPKVNGFYPMYVRSGDQVMRRLYRSTNYAALPLLDFLGVSQISSSNEMFRWDARRSAMPLITAGQLPVFSPSTEIFQNIFSEQFMPRQTVYLSEQARDQVKAATNGCRIVSTNIQAHRLVAAVEASGPSLVVIAQTDYPAWRAFIDGTPVPIWRANYAYQAVVVSAGLHRVELRFENSLFKVGCMISLLGLASCLLLFGLQDRVRGKS